MNETKIPYDVLMAKYNAAIKREMAMKRKISSLTRENKTLNRCLVFLTFTAMVLAIFMVR